MSSELLLEFFNKHKCDKGFKHRYHEIYADLFASVYARFGRVDLLEIGVFKGASTLAFAEYLSYLDIPFKITGIDTFERVDLERVVSSIRKSSFIDSNVKYIKCDSQDITTSRLDDIGMHNIIIDDAEHTPDANRTTLENFWGNLYEDGIYVIEDVWPLDDMSYEELGHFWLEKYKEEFTEEKFKDFIQTVECFDIEYSRRDLRNPHPDSYMFILQR